MTSLIKSWRVKANTWCGENVTTREGEQRKKMWMEAEEEEQMVC